MEQYFDFKLIRDGIGVQFSNSLSIEEREIHAYHEILYCEDASLVFYTENQKTQMCGEHLFIIPKGKYHMFDLSCVKEFKRLKISIPDHVIKATSVGMFSSDVCALPSISQLSKLLINNVCCAMQSGVETVDEFYVSSAVMMLIAELNMLKMRNGTNRAENSGNRIIRQIIEYVSNGLESDLSVQALAKIANVSMSYLTHEFQKEVGISLHRYIVQKRMVYAKELIDLGKKPTKIYTECGYNDYSSFYKAYRLFHGFRPQKNK